MDKEYIEREALLKSLTHDEENETCTLANVFLGLVKKIIEKAPAADVEVVRHGEWKVVYSNNMGTVYECSECGHLTFGTSDYCICGAKMDRQGDV